MPVQIQYAGALKKKSWRMSPWRAHAVALLNELNEKRRAADNRASAQYDWLCGRQHTEARCWPGGSYIWPISSQSLRWLSTPLRACWNNIIRTWKCWRLPCPLPAQNSESRKHFRSDLSAPRPGPFPGWNILWGHRTAAQVSLWCSMDLIKLM